MLKWGYALASMLMTLPTASTVRAQGLLEEAISGIHGDDLVPGNDLNNAMRPPTQGIEIFGDDNSYIRNPNDIRIIESRPFVTCKNPPFC